jgi:NADPH2:quinone reductase
MRAVMLVPGPAGATAEVRDIPQPAPRPGEVLVKVHAAGVNRGEIAVRRGLRSGSPQQSGIEFAGEVTALGDGASGVGVGDRVMGHWRGGQAEHVAVDPRLLVPVPQRLSWIEAAAWLNVFVTAHDAMVTNAQLKPGESVLVNAASSGIGVAALQIARLLGARPVIGSSRSAAKRSQLARHGLEHGIDPADAGWPEAVKAATGGGGVDVVIDSVGGEALPGNIDCLALKGRLVSVGRLGALRGEIDLDRVALNRLHLIGVTFRTRSLAERIACVQACARDLLPALADGRIGPVIDRTFPLAGIAAAHDYMERDNHIGKIVLTVGGSA